MRLLLDEHYPAAIAAELRSRGHDVRAVAERPDLAGLDDRSLFAAAAREGRAVVTENLRDFLALGREALRDGAEHPGLVLVSPRAFPRSRRDLGALIRALDALLAACPAEGALVNQARWLAAPEPASGR